MITLAKGKLIEPEKPIWFQSKILNKRINIRFIDKSSPKYPFEHYEIREKK